VESIGTVFLALPDVAEVLARASADPADRLYEVRREGATTVARRLNRGGTFGGVVLILVFVSTNVGFFRLGGERSGRKGGHVVDVGLFANRSGVAGAIVGAIVHVVEGMLLVCGRRGGVARGLVPVGAILAVSADVVVVDEVGIGGRDVAIIEVSTTVEAAFSVEVVVGSGLTSDVIAVSVSSAGIVTTDTVGTGGGGEGEEESSDLHGR